MRIIKQAILDGIEDPNSKSSEQIVMHRTTELNSRIYSIIEHQSQAKFDQSLPEAEKKNHEKEAAEAFRDVAKALGFEHLLST